MPDCEPYFVSEGTPWPAVLGRDFVNFLMLGAYYLLCFLVALPLLVVDRCLGTSGYERFIRLMEFIDNGGR
ncbi:hypothetical protein HPO96_05490 [Kribbella sandramycini]|uniref:Uncharacterized protein n=1 Tax=Kribbella sandramycini TaxID=60450 RepID=A0A7Y4NXA9_9ACTN|nr:hypothetical protein [Kribbella sandramycini]MBB6567708.1 hypothetical protein [Kribbella sandramycini]NOL39692.1 hypothetical protein [Kribbella sandramycini]